MRRATMDQALMVFPFKQCADCRLTPIFAEAANLIDAVLCP